MSTEVSTRTLLVDEPVEDGQIKENELPTLTRLLMHTSPTSR